MERAGWKERKCRRWFLVVSVVRAVRSVFEWLDDDDDGERELHDIA